MSNDYLPICINRIDINARQMSYTTIPMFDGEMAPNVKKCMGAPSSIFAVISLGHEGGDRFIGAFTNVGTAEKIARLLNDLQAKPDVASMLAYNFQACLV